MALGQLVFLPGFLGSHLDRINTLLPNTRFWLSFRPILAGYISLLEQDDTGLAPASPLFTGNVQPAGTLLEYYEPILRQLNRDWTGAEFSYDWRLPLGVLGFKLYDAVQATFPTGDVYFVCHSLGGLLARLAYKRASDLGTAARWKRIVTLGTPHWGSYSAVATFTRQSETFRNLYLASLPANITIANGLQILATGAVTDHLDRVVTSWPSLYELFPSVHQPGLIGDPERADLLVIAEWAQINVRVKAAHLALAASTHQALLAAQPPDSVMVSVVGRGIPTAAAVVSPLDLSGQTGFVNDDGDGTVTAQSATMKMQRKEVFSSHADLPRHPTVLAELNDWLLNGIMPGLPVETFVGVFSVPGPGGPAGTPTSPTTSQTTVPILPFNPSPAPAGPTPRPAYCP